MDMDAILQIANVLLATLVIIGHQQDNTDQLREDLNAANHQLREDFNNANRQHREDFNKLHEGITENGQRLARIEGFSAIGMPTVADESIDAGSK